MEKQTNDMILVELSNSIITEPKTPFPASSSDGYGIEAAEITPTPPVSGTESDHRTTIRKKVIFIFNMMKVLALFYPKKMKHWKFKTTDAAIQELVVENPDTDGDRLFPNAAGRKQKRRRTNPRKRLSVLPLSSKDLPNTNIQIQQKALSSKSFLSFAFQSVHDMSPRDCRFILMTCLGLVGYYAKNSTTPFDDFLSGKTTNTPESLISSGKAFSDYSNVIAHITTFMVCYILTCILALQKRFGVQMILVIPVLATPIYYFQGQKQKASALGVHVACGTFKLPLIWFTTFAAVGCSFLCGLLVMSVVYWKWKSLRKVNQC